MQGHGYAAPPPRRPSTGVLVLLRVIFVAVALLSIGFLAWVATLRAAIVTRRAADWWIFAASVVVLGISFGFLSTDHTDDFSTPNGNTGMIILLLNAVVCAGYYLYADIRHFHRPHQAYAGQQPSAPGYGYPQPPSPYAATLPQTPVAPAPGHHTPIPVPPPPPQRPAPARIDQVRAELDELSDYLRQHPGHSEGNHEGGR
ncbi:YppG family protein [Streptomyces guryensis]|uniref:YppG family protein n=1 Tax=Streptomyces guryensis TaxID=2886947 RepID=A0A9Q3ZAN7_9ACTN|nr:YppG family protein [Streptomyces guryensis]MCD9875535.1 YppG family protein [Streptomyces guryensis]